MINAAEIRVTFEAFYNYVKATLGVHTVGPLSHLFEHKRAKLIRLCRDKLRLKSVKHIVGLLLLVLVTKREQAREVMRDYNLQIISPVHDKLVR